MGILLADCLSSVGSGSGCALSIVQVVCGIEAAAERCLAELFLKGWSPKEANGPNEAGAICNYVVAALCRFAVSAAWRTVSSYWRDYLCFVPPLEIPFGLGTWGSGLDGTRTRICNLIECSVPITPRAL